MPCKPDRQLNIAHRPLFWFICLFLFAHSFVGLSQQSAVPHPSSVGPIVKELPMPSSAPLFLESETYTSTLYLVNQLLFGVQVDVTLFDMSGSLLTTKHLYLEPNSQQSASVKRILAEGGLYSEAGSLEIVTPDNSAAVLGQLSIARTGSNKAYLDEELFMSGEAGSQTIRSVIDSPENSPIVAITNVSTSASQTLRISCFPSKGERVDKVLGIQPKQTKLVRACSSDSDGVFSADAIDSQFTLATGATTGMSGQGVAGISITTDGPPGELAAFGFVEHDDAFGRYFSAMNFSDPKLLHSSGFVFAGVPVGGSRLLPSAYAPQVAVTNFSTQAKTVKVFLATSSDDGSNTQKQVAAISLSSGSSRLIDLRGLSGNEDWQNSFVVRSDGQPGDVIAKMMFKAVGPLPNIEVLGKDEFHTQTAGDHPWSVENGIRSTLFLFNHSTSQKEITVRLGSGTDVWMKMYTLSPNETRALSINDLLQAETLDMKGHIFPLTKTTGEAAWWSPSGSSPQVSGRVVQIDAAETMARNFSCYNYEGLCALSVLSDPLNLAFQGDGGLGSSTTFCMYPSAPNSCPNDGQYAASGTSLTWSWSSANSSVASVVSGAATSTSTWKGMATGSTRSSVTAKVSSNYQNSCTGGGAVSVGIQLTIGLTDCSDTAKTGQIYAGWYLNPNNLGGCAVSENVPKAALPLGGTCNVGGGAPTYYSFKNANGTTTYVYPTRTRMADSGCTTFIDGLSGVVTSTVVP